MRKLFAALALTFIFVVPVGATDWGGNASFDAPKTIVAKKSEITLRITYTCIQYITPYNANDIIGVVLFGEGPGFYSANVPITCDNRERKLILVLNAYNGGISGPATLVLGHQGNAADFQADGSIGISTESGNNSFLVTVIEAGHK